MAFSLFTKRTEYTSKRLRVIARGLQIGGVALGMLTVVTAFSVYDSDVVNIGEELRVRLLRTIAAHGILECVSSFVIGAALLRRQRWAAYVAAATIGLPTALELISDNSGRPLPLVFQVVPFVALALIASVWRELGTVRDSQFADHRPEPEPEIPLTPRNRGYGEPRSLPLGNTPATTTIAASTPLPIRNARDN